MSNQRHGPHDPSALERSLQAERKELEIRQNGGHLKLIGFPLDLRPTKIFGGVLKPFLAAPTPSSPPHGHRGRKSHIPYLDFRKG